MPTRTVDPHFSRVSWAVVVALLVCSILVGLEPLISPLTAYAPVLAVPAAAGLPALIPPLRLTPLGGSTWGFWAADVAGVLVMLAAAFVLLRAGDRRRPNPSILRAFGRGVGVTVLAVIAGNLVRGVFSSFAVHMDFGTYLGTTAANIAVSALFGAAVGLIVGVAAAVVAAVAGRRLAASDPEASGPEASDPAASDPAASAPVSSAATEAPADTNPAVTESAPADARG
ncbi:hypothetical protein BJ978_001179 [Agromyces terreus]|uniref:Uncharacterized protein n=1 Tax=Agromyces terreus TaxID=424795 RepID=A0A9X2H0S5_9MICO|nr:hypothetical protein [Agromyces terreus]MCP2370503.1 hypothetical protein [Agromyces terreus]